MDTCANIFKAILLVAGGMSSALSDNVEMVVGREKNSAHAEEGCNFFSPNICA